MKASDFGAIVAWADGRERELREKIDAMRWRRDQRRLRDARLSLASADRAITRHSRARFLLALTRVRYGASDGLHQEIAHHATAVRAARTARRTAIEQIEALT